VVTKISVFSIAARSFSWPGLDASSMMAAYIAFCFVMRISLSSACRASVAIAVWKVENSARRGYFDHFCTKPDDCRRLPPIAHDGDVANVLLNPPKRHQRRFWFPFSSKQ
jgi:hypothetical protein